VVPDAYSASIQRAAEASYCDRHSQQHQAEQRDRNTLIEASSETWRLVKDGLNDLISSAVRQTAASQHHRMRLRLLNSSIVWAGAEKGPNTA
jgi:hypothetical protein